MRIEFEYEGELVWYDEDSMAWRWAGSGRGYGEPKNVREAIDRAQGKGKNGLPKFERQRAIYWNYQGIREVDVTSQAEGFEYWISSASGRSKVDQKALFAVTKENNQKLDGWRAKAEQVKAIQKEMISIQESMQGFHEWLKDQKK